MAGVGQQGQGIGAETEDHLDDDKGRVQRRRKQEAPAEVDRRMMMAVPVVTVMAVTVVMRPIMRPIMRMVIMVVMIVMIVSVVVIVGHGCAAKEKD